MRSKIFRRAGLATPIACAAILGLSSQAMAVGTWSTANVAFNHSNWVVGGGSPFIAPSANEVQLGYTINDKISTYDHVVPNPDAQCWRYDSDNATDYWWWTGTDFVFNLERFGQQQANSGIRVDVYDTRTHQSYFMGVFGANIPAFKPQTEDITLSQFGNDTIDITISMASMSGAGDKWALWSPQITTTDYGSGGYNLGVPGYRSNCAYAPNSFFGTSYRYFEPAWRLVG